MAVPSPHIDPPRARRPEPRDLDLLRRILSVGYLLAGFTAIGAALLAGADQGNLVLLIAGFSELIIAAALALWRGMPPALIKFLGIPGAILLVSVAVACARPLGPAPIYYLWPALNCAFYGTRRDARVASLLMCTSFALALALSPDAQVPIVTYFAVVSIFLLVLVAVQYQVERTDGLVQELAHAAATDSLTGLLDRRAFSQAFAREVERAHASGLSLSVVFFDLDHFKAVNDGFGHAAGDEALCAFARIIEQECSVADLTARMGGEEFAIVLFDADVDVAKDFVARIAGALSQWSAEHPPMLTTSAGIAVLGEEAMTPSQLLTSADQALYAAKAAGRNRVIASGQTTARVLVCA
jgi:diguanylate cyclase (GGDEF)-like protein